MNRDQTIRECRRLATLALCRAGEADAREGEARCRGDRGEEARYNEDAAQYRQMVAAFDAAVAVLGAVVATPAAPPAQLRITTPCPSCGFASLFIGDGGHLTCSRIGCSEPGVERAIAALRATS